MSVADHWMPLYIGDYLADTGHLTTEQHGAYLLLLMAYWRDGALPANDRRLAHISRLSLARWRRLAPPVLGMFEHSLAALVSRRAEVWRHWAFGRLDATAWNKLRSAVFERDGEICHYCGSTSGPFDCDHVYPLSRGGTNDLSNLVASCFSCNRSKGAKLVSEWRS